MIAALLRNEWRQQRSCLVVASLGAVVLSLLSGALPSGLMIEDTAAVIHAPGLMLLYFAVCGTDLGVTDPRRLSLELRLPVSGRTVWFAKCAFYLLGAVVFLALVLAINALVVVNRGGSLQEFARVLRGDGAILLSGTLLFGAAVAALSVLFLRRGLALWGAALLVGVPLGLWQQGRLRGLGEEFLDPRLTPLLLRYLGLDHWLTLPLLALGVFALTLAAAGTGHRPTWLREGRRIAQATVTAVSLLIAPVVLVSGSAWALYRTVSDLSPRDRLDSLAWSHLSPDGRYLILSFHVGATSPSDELRWIWAVDLTNGEEHRVGSLGARLYIPANHVGSSPFTSASTLRYLSATRSEEQWDLEGARRMNRSEWSFSDGLAAPEWWREGDSWSPIRRGPFGSRKLFLQDLGLAELDGRGWIALDRRRHEALWVDSGGLLWVLRLDEGEAPRLLCDGFDPEATPYLSPCGKYVRIQPPAACATRVIRIEDGAAVLQTESHVSWNGSARPLLRDYDRDRLYLVDEGRVLPLDPRVRGARRVQYTIASRLLVDVPGQGVFELDRHDGRAHLLYGPEGWAPRSASR